MANRVRRRQIPRPVGDAGYGEGLRRGPRLIPDGGSKSLLAGKGLELVDWEFPAKMRSYCQIWCTGS